MNKENIQPTRVTEFLNFIRQQCEQQTQQRNRTMSEQDSDLGFMDISLDDIVDYGTLPDGTEAELQVIDVQPNQEKKYVLVTFAIKDQANMKDIRHFVSYPKADDEAKKANTKKIMLRDFMAALGLDSPVITTDIIGRECVAILGFDEATGQYPEQNRIKKFVSPK